MAAEKTKANVIARNEGISQKEPTSLKPKLRFKEFEGEWEIKKLGDISSKVAYGMNSAAIPFDGKHKYLRITDIDEDSREFKGSSLTSPDGLIEDKFKMKLNDIVFARTGASTGKSYLYNPEDGDLYYAGFLIKFNVSKANSYFVYSQTFKESYRKWVQVYSMRSGQPGLNAEEYKSLRISIPQGKEQQKIANFLTAVDTKLQQLTTKREKLSQYKKGVMQQLFSQQLRFKPDVIARNEAISQNETEFPDWEEKKLKDFVKINQGLQIAISERYTKPVENGYFYITNEFLRKKSEKQYFIKNPPNSVICNKDDILMTRTGNTGQVVTGVEGAFHNNFFKIKFDSSCYKDFLFYFLTSVKTQHIIMSLAGTSTIPDLNHGDFYKIEIRLPSLKEQQKIANYLSAIDTKIATVQTQISNTKQFKKGLLQQMFV
jgi:type I restriction enzyme S subunit